MNVNFLFFRTIRLLLLPFSLLYALVVIVRNWLFDRKILPSSSFNLPIICVGNLAVGGTGKSPMVEFLIGKLKDEFKLAVLSRGYKRKTRGYALAGETSTALDIGDEPMQFHTKFPDVAVAVGEERVVAVPQLLHDRPELQAIILDDAYQHRSIRAGFNIILTDINNLFTRDWFLPTGDLRDQKSSYRRAQVIVVTKCEKDLSLKERNDIIREIGPVKGQEIFFSCIEYGQPYQIISRQETSLTSQMEVLLVSGIANPGPLKNYLTENTKTYYEIDFGDHHIFSIDDLRTIMRRFDALQAPDKMILTTEKDAVRLMKFQQELKDRPVYVLPIRPGFLFNAEKQFTGMVAEFIRHFKFQNE